MFAPPKFYLLGGFCLILFALDVAAIVVAIRDGTFGQGIVTLILTYLLSSAMEIVVISVRFNLQRQRLLMTVAVLTTMMTITKMIMRHVFRRFETSN